LLKIILPIKINLTLDIPQSVKDTDGRIVIKAFKETEQITTKIQIPWLSVLSIGPQLLTKLQSQDLSWK